MYGVGLLAWSLLCCHPASNHTNALSSGLSSLLAGEVIAGWRLSARAHSAGRAKFKLSAFLQVKRGDADEPPFSVKQPAAT